VAWTTRTYGDPDDHLHTNAFDCLGHSDSGRPDDAGDSHSNTDTTTGTGDHSETGTESDPRRTSTTTSPTSPGTRTRTRARSGTRSRSGTRGETGDHRVHLHQGRPKLHRQCVIHDRRPSGVDHDNDRPSRSAARCGGEWIMGNRDRDHYGRATILHGPAEYRGGRGQQFGNIELT